MDDDKKRIAILANRFKAYRQSMNHCWESYVYLEYLLNSNSPILNSNVKLPRWHSGSVSKISDKNTYGIVDYVKKKELPSNTLLKVVSLTEDFLQDIATIVYKWYPNKLEGKRSESVGVESEDRRSKLLHLIISQKDREDIIDILIEEKVRGIFYGNPASFFLDDKAKIGFKDYFKNEHSDKVELYKEIIARRNIFTHNGGRVDRKYLKEVQLTAFKYKEYVKIDVEYIRETLVILKGLSALVTKFTIEKYGKGTNHNRQILFAIEVMNNL